MRMQRIGGKIVWLLGILGLLIVGAVDGAYATDLGSDALAFDVLSLGGKVILGKGSQAGLGGNSADLGMVGGTSALLQKGSQSVNEVVTHPHGIVLQKGAEAFGCITSGAKIKLAAGAMCVNLIDNGGQRPELTTLSNAISEASLFADVANSQPASQTLDKIVVPKNGQQVITNTEQGLNVIATPSLTLKKDAVLQISGQSGDDDIILVHGNLNWGADASISFNGVLTTHLMIVVSGKLVSIGKGSQLIATILAPHATCEVGAGAQVIGEIVCGKKIQLDNGSQVQYVTTAVTLP